MNSSAAREDVADVRQQATRRDCRGKVDALLLEEADLRRHSAHSRHREVRERHRQLELGRAKQWQLDRDRPHERDRGREVREERDDEGGREPSPVRVLDRVVELLGVADLAEQGEHRDQRAHRHQQTRGVHAVELLERGDLGRRRQLLSRSAGSRGSASAPFVRAVRELRISRLSAGDWRNGSAAATPSLPTPRMAAAIALSSPTIAAVLASSSATSAARRSGDAAPTRVLEVGDGDALLREDEMACVQTRRARRAPRASCVTWRHASLSTRSVTALGSTSDIRGPVGRPLHEEGRIRSRLPGDDDLGNTGAGPLRPAGACRPGARRPEGG